jgi:hypothetical protein
MITINGKTYQGNNLQITGNRVYIDGKPVDQEEDEKTINISVDGDIQTLKVDSCNQIDVTGNCKSVNSTNGNIQVKGNIEGDVVNKNGNIVCRNVSGSVTTKNGNITHV